MRTLIATSLFLLCAAITTLILVGFIEGVTFLGVHLLNWLGDSLATH